METRANFVVIGVFTLLAIIGGLGFFVWLANFQVNRQYDHYDVIFDSVSGLSPASDVRFNGLTVGQVTAIGLSTEQAGKVRVRIEVAADTPITEDTSAQLAAQGVTGVSYVSLTSGAPDSPPLTAPGDEIPEIVAQRSVVQALAEDAPDLVTSAVDLLDGLKELIGPENQAYVASILGNLDRASGELQRALDDFSTISQSVAEATGQIGAFTGRLEGISASLQTTLDTANGTLEAAEAAFAQGETTLASADTTFATATRTFAGANTVIEEQVPGIVADLSAAAATLRTAASEISGETSALLTSFGGTADAATARLTELQTTLANLDTMLGEATTTLAAVTSASESFETLVDGDGTALVAEARMTLANLDRTFDEEVPAMVAEIRTAVEGANRVIAEAGEDLTAFTGELKPLTATAGTTLEAATQTLRDASASLERIDAAMTTAERTLAAAEGTFAGAERIIEQEVAPTAADIREASARISASVEQVADDLPAITADLRDTVARANSVIAEVDAVVSSSAGPVRDFTTDGLPQFVRFTAEARALVASLEQLVRRIERDPAGLFLGGRVPEYRR